MGRAIADAFSSRVEEPLSCCHHQRVAAPAIYLNAGAGGPSEAGAIKPNRTPQAFTKRKARALSQVIRAQVSHPGARGNSRAHHFESPKKSRPHSEHRA